MTELTTSAGRTSHSAAGVEASVFVLHEDGVSRAAALDAHLRTLDGLVDRIAAIAAFVPGRVAFSTSLGIEDQAVTHAIAAIEAGVDVFTLDTGRHFPETLETLKQTELRYRLKIRVAFPEAAEVEALVARDGIMGFRDGIDERKACCEVRKVRPLAKALSGAAGWVTGLRRGQSQGRAEVPFATWDGAFNLVKINPIADWTLERLEAYVEEHDIPVNTLHGNGFPSIGCQPCTRAIKPGEDIRAGRWWWESEIGKECGLHSHQHKREARA